MTVYCPLAAENGCCNAPRLIEADMARLAALGPLDEGEAMFVVVPNRCGACLDDVSAAFGPAGNAIDILPRGWRPHRT